MMVAALVIRIFGHGLFKRVERLKLDFSALPFLLSHILFLFVDVERGR